MVQEVTAEHSASPRLKSHKFPSPLYIALSVYIYLAFGSSRFRGTADSVEHICRVQDACCKIMIHDKGFIVFSLRAMTYVQWHMGKMDCWGVYAVNMISRSHQKGCLISRSWIGCTASRVSAWSSSATDVPVPLAWSATL